MTNHRHPARHCAPCFFVCRQVEPAAATPVIMAPTPWLSSSGRPAQALLLRRRLPTQPDPARVSWLCADARVGQRLPAHRGGRAAHAGCHQRAGPAARPAAHPPVRLLESAGPVSAGPCMLVGSMFGLLCVWSDALFGGREFGLPEQLLLLPAHCPLPALLYCCWRLHAH